MLKLIITVGGPGCIFHTEMALIYEALTSAGLEVEIQDDYPPDNYPLSEDRLKWLREKGGKVVLRADHRPWGG